MKLGRRGSRPPKGYRRARALLISWILIWSAVGFVYLGYTTFGHELVDAIYRGDAPEFLRGIISGQDEYPVDRYYLEADIQFERMFLAVLWIAALASAAALIAILFRPWTKKRLMFTAVAMFLIAASVIVWNRGRFEIREFRLAAGQVLERTQTLKELAIEFEADEILQTLPKSRLNGFFYRFDDHFSEDASIFGHSHSKGSGRGAEAHVADEYENSDSPIFLPQTDQYLIADGNLSYPSSRMVFLTNSAPLQLQPHEIHSVEIRMRTAKGSRAFIGWSADFGDLSRSRNSGIWFDLVQDGEFHDYSITLEGSLRGSGTAIESIFIRPTNQENEIAEIDSVRILDKRQKWQHLSPGVDYATLGNEMRRAIHNEVPYRLSYQVSLPEEKLQLNVGMGVLSEGSDVFFSVIATRISDGRQTKLIKTSVRSSDRWFNESVDLTELGGNEVRLEFSAESEDRGVAFWANPTIRGDRQERFNVILVLEDTFRADYLSSIDPSKNTTPEKDRLAQRGLLFRNAVSQATKTRPSVPALMTSMHPSATGVWHSADRLPDGYITLAEVMRSQGFSTASFVQNHNAGFFAGLHQGFDLVLDERALGTSTEDVYGDQLRNWLDSHLNGNFFLYLHIIDPHGPYDPLGKHSEALAEVELAGKPVPRMTELDPDWVGAPSDDGRKLRYGEEVRSNDHQFGQFLDRLDHLGVLDDTLIVFVSDHGEQHGEHGLWGHEPPGYLSGIRVPLIMGHPRLLPRGEILDEPVQTIDVMPTILDLAGIPTETLILQGDSLVPLAKRENLPRWRNRVVVSEEVVNRKSSESAAWGSVFFGPHQVLTSKETLTLASIGKKIGLRPSANTGLESKIFDWSRGPGQDKPRRSFALNWLLKREVRLFLNEAFRRNRQLATSLRGQAIENSEVDPEVQQRLKALGYLE